MIEKRITGPAQRMIFFVFPGCETDPTFQPAVRNSERRVGSRERYDSTFILLSVALHQGTAEQTDGSERRPERTWAEQKNNEERKKKKNHFWQGTAGC